MDNGQWLDEIEKEVQKERENYKGPHCCLTMEYGLSSHGITLYYDKNFREYGLKIPNSIEHMIMNYCIFCGKNIINLNMYQKTYINSNNELPGNKIEEGNVNYQRCCLTMHYELLSNSTILHYNALYREYGVRIPESTGCMLMDYCLFCGQKMPPSLRDEWFDILEQEHQLDDPMDDDRKKIPQEFLTDEWWKKRNL